MRTESSCKTVLKVAIGTLSILVGGLLYVILRTKRLLMFSWFEQLGLGGVVDSLRSNYGNHTVYAWIKYNLPAALWLFSYLYIMDSIWSKCSNKATYWLFMSVVPLMAICSEFLQYFKAVSGTFDDLDVLAYCGACILFFTLKLFK